jgi:NAD(P) transhydrogenase subunit alpha
VVVKHDVTIVSPLNLPATMPEHASQLYARNVQALLELLLIDNPLLHDGKTAMLVGDAKASVSEITEELKALT